MCIRDSHIPGTFNRLFNLSLTTSTVATALTRVYLAAIGQQFLQCLNIFVINVFYCPSTETAQRPGCHLAAGTGSALLAKKA